MTYSTTADDAPRGSVKLTDTTPASIDKEIQAAIAAGEHRQALEFLACAYLDTVFRYCFRMLHEDKERARDVTQRVFEEVCKGITAYRGDASAKTWLLAIARNLCLKDIDTRKRRSSILRQHQGNVAAHVHTDPPSRVEVTVLSQEGLMRLRWALDQLEPDERSLLIMRFGIGVPYELSATDIAQVQGISRAAAYRKLQEALTRLRRILHDEAG